MITEKCKKCGTRHRKLTDEKLCAICDYPNWHKKYTTFKGRGKK